MTQFIFTYHQAIPTAHPIYEVDIYFRVTAEIDQDDETVNILRISASSAFADQTTQSALIRLPNEANHAGAMFLGKLREAARQAYYDIQNDNVHTPTTIES